MHISHIISYYFQNKRIGVYKIRVVSDTCIVLMYHK